MRCVAVGGVLSGRDGCRDRAFGAWEVDSGRWNQDTGYGLCPKCAAWIATREPVDEMRRTYGAPGVHYALDMEAGQ